LPIPEGQLATWSNSGAQTTAAATGRAIRDALNSPTSLVRGRNKAIYLQGSYKNSTNIRGDSDVDVVVQLRASFGYDVSTLTLLSAHRSIANLATPLIRSANFDLKF
jgi:tRNA nucleotidyltransferase (CCA-adding enzyme)